MTSEPAPEKSAAPLPPSSACLGLLQRPSGIASRRPACAAAVLLITVLVPLVTGAAPLPPPRPRNQGSAPSPPPAPIQPAPAQPSPAASPPDQECLAGLQRLGFNAEAVGPPPASEAACVIDQPVRLRSLRLSAEPVRDITFPDGPVVACRFAERFGHWVGDLAAVLVRAARDGPEGGAHRSGVRVSQAQSRRLREAQRSRARACRGRCWLRACVRRAPVRHREPRQPEGDVAIGPAPSVLWLVHDDLRTGHGRHACRPLAFGYSTARVERLLPDLPVARVPCRSRKRRARPRGSTVPRRPYGALGQRGPLGPAPLRSGPLAARGERAGLRGRPLSGASCNQGSWKGPQPHARTTITLPSWTSARVNLRHVDLVRRGPVSSTAGLAGVTQKMGRRARSAARTGNIAADS